MSKEPLYPHVPKKKEPLYPHRPKSQIDLRKDFDEKAEVLNGILYRKGNIVQVWWSDGSKETWTSDEANAKKNFQDMKERWEQSLEQIDITKGVIKRGKELVANPDNIPAARAFIAELRRRADEAQAKALTTTESKARILNQNARQARMDADRIERTIPAIPEVVTPVTPEVTGVILTEAEDLLSRIGEEWIAGRPGIGFTRNQVARAKAGIATIAKKYGIDKNVLWKNVWWEAEIKPEVLEYPTAEEIEDLIKSVSRKAEITAIVADLNLLREEKVWIDTFKTKGASIVHLQTGDTATIISPPEDFTSPNYTDRAMQIKWTDGSEMVVDSNDFAPSSLQKQIAEITHGKPIPKFPTAEE